MPRHLAADRVARVGFRPGGAAFGEDQLIDCVNQLERTGRGVRAVTRALSHPLKRARGGHTTDDATLLMVEWRG